MQHAVTTRRPASTRGASILCAWNQRPAISAFRRGVSLHSHTSHSKETLDFIPRFAAACPPVRAMLARYEARYRRIHGRELDYFSAWWTPPLGPREALAVERAQIEALGLPALVSITDHDNIEAPLLLRVLSESRDTPIGVEWTVPWRGPFFHLGIHNLPSRRANERMAALASFTASPHEPDLAGLLDWLSEDPETLIVFNHPYWDEKGLGQAWHNRLTEEFLRCHKPWLHALELNGLRPWAENQRTLQLAVSSHLPAISGGDRHTCEPNALLNMTMARSFSEFVEEIRVERISHIVVMPQYREPLTARVLTAIADVMRDNIEHTHGWTRWSDRVFYRRPDGDVDPLSSAFREGREPSLIRLFVAGARLLDSRGVQAAVRQILQPAQEVTP